MYFKFKHLGIAVKDIRQAINMYQLIFEYKILSGPYDDPIQKSSVCFVGGDDPVEPVIELISPLGEGSFVNKILSKDIGIYHICYEVQDIDKVLETVRQKECLIVSKPVPAVAFDGKRIAWFYMPTHQLVEVVEQ